MPPNLTISREVREISEFEGGEEDRGGEERAEPSVFSERVCLMKGLRMRKEKRRKAQLRESDALSTAEARVWGGLTLIVPIITVWH